ncbi:YchJ family protein [Pedobacter frigiditerrae]|uniref:YchJ family protein n=1 Tax=Pedobacter frigiditerrae TaxID=2530452 RepID=UPI00292FDA1B|nr:YchJ family protein [Pedobacter frigiditerrae]
MHIDCPCCSSLSYANCCQPFHLDKEKPLTPEKLMRSRFSAYALHLIDYLIETTHPSQIHFYERKEIENWAKSNVWLKLEICEAKEDIVEFKAFYQNGLKTFIHHETSIFKQEHGIWYYLKGTYPKQ